MYVNYSLIVIINLNFILSVYHSLVEFYVIASIGEIGGDSYSKHFFIFFLWTLA